jgi:hexokinase
MDTLLPSSYTTNLENLDSIADRFSTEILAAKDGNYSSLKYIQTQLPLTPIIERPTHVCIVIVGGSHLRVTEIEIDRESYQEIKSVREDLPLLESGHELLELIKKQIPKSTELVLLNLAFPVSSVTHNGMLDAILLKESKGHRLKDLLGKKVGSELEAIIGNDTKVLCVNDNVCTTLSVSSYPTIGFIAGTGINIAFRKEADKIINLEAGYFNKFNANTEVLGIDT